MATLVQRFRNNFYRGLRAMRSRHRIVEFLKTMALVLPLTLLIWIYAERAQLWDADVQVQFDVSITDAALFPRLIEPGNGQVQLKLSGPRSKVEQLRSELQRSSNSGLLRFQIQTKYDPDTEPTIPAIDLVNSDPMIAESGVTVTSVTPPTLKVHIDQIVTRELKIDLPQMGPGAGKVQNIVFEPQTAVVRGPESKLDQLFPAGSSLTVDMSAYRNELTKPGTRELVNVPINVPREPGISVRPQVVRSLRFDVAQDDREFVIRAMPIQVTKPYRVEQQQVQVNLREDTVTGIRVRGPSLEIAKLEGEAPTVTPSAMLVIRPEDVGRSDLIRDVEIVGLPPGVYVVDGKPQVQFSVHRSEGSIPLTP